MTPKSKIQKLRRWMVKTYGKETWSDFKKYFEENKGYESLKELAEVKPIEGLINFAFYWGRTKRKCFWSGVHMAWMKYVNQEIEKWKN